MPIYIGRDMVFSIHIFAVKCKYCKYIFFIVGLDGVILLLRFLFKFPLVYFTKTFFQDLSLFVSYE
jgi:hypothetical protein